MKSTPVTERPSKGRLTDNQEFTGEGRGRAPRPRVARRGAGPGPLGIPANLSTGSPYGKERPTDRNLLRAARQDAAAQLLPRERVAHCCRTPVGAVVQLVKTSSGHGKAVGLQTCGSVWHCPVCAAKIAEVRSQELGAGVETWRGRRGLVLLVTYTVRHSDRDSLAWLVSALRSARNHCRSGGWATRWKQRHGVVGSVVALECTHGENGWHPHLHELLFVEEGCDVDQLRAELLERWQSCVVAAGLGSVNEHGINVTECQSAVADYVTKFGHEPTGAVPTWGPEHELAKAAVKKGRGGNRNPVQLLDAAAFEGDQVAAALWLEYAGAMKGEAQLRWSAGLRELLELGQGLSDQEAAELETDTGTTFGTLEAWEWRRVCDARLRAELLQLVGIGAREGVERLLVALGCRLALWDDG